MSFLFQPLLWGSLLVGAPVLIHLINMMRHRKVRWAAMDFLLQSQKRHKKWIVLKQLLLLLLRMAAVAAIVFMVAQPLWQNDWGKLFGGSETHHIVLLDDSFSMTDRWGDSSAFERAKRVVQRLAQQAGLQGTSQTFSLIRFSSAANLALGSQHDMTQQTIDRDFDAKLEKLLGPMEPSQTGATPLDALEAVKALPSKSDDETRLVYIVSDFRTKEWDDPKSLRKALDELSEEKTRLHLVQCVDAARPNLAVTQLKPLMGTRAAGVELFMEVAVKNFGDDLAREVSIGLEEDGHSRPGIVIDEIGPGEVVTRRFRVNYPTAGGHTLAASIGGDTVLVDNTRYAALDIADVVPVLIIDGATEARDGYFLAAALNPGGSVRTGLRPQIERPRFLRKVEELEKFDTIFIANLSHLDQAEIETLEQFVKSGGGVVFFMGELCPAKFYTEHLYRGGEGLFPVPLWMSTDLLPDLLGKAPDVDVEDHVLFKTFLNMRNNPLDNVVIQRYFATPREWKPEPDSGVNVLAHLRNGSPLFVERKFGEGRVLAVLTKASPDKTRIGTWNNWARGHSYLPLINNIQGYLAAGRQTIEDRLVGQPIELQLDAKGYRSKVTFSLPGRDLLDTLVVDAVSTEEGTLEASLNDTAKSGIYAVEMTTVDEVREDQYFAYNVVGGEGDLHMLDRQQLAERLKGLQYTYHRAEAFEYDPQEVAGFNMSETLLYILILILIGEQLLAYSASYHPPRVEVTRR